MWKSPAVRIGLLVGLMTVVVMFCFYLVDNSWAYRVSLRGGVMLIYLIGMIKAGQSIVKAEPNQDFRFIIRPIFVVFLVANLIYFVYYYLLFNVIDPDLVAGQKAYFLQMAASHGQITEENRQVFLQETMQGELTSARAVLYNYASGAIGGFALSAALAFVLKRLY